MKAWKAREYALSLFQGQVTDLIGSAINHYWTFLIGPDGSKAGWDGDQEGDDRRAKFIAWLRDEAYEDGTSLYEWAEVRYWDDDLDVLIESSGAQDMRARRKP